MKDRVAFITGAAGGIGLEIARQFVLEGASVMICDMDKNKLSAAVSGLAVSGFEESEAAFEGADAAGSREMKVAGVVCDVTQEEQVKAALDGTLQRFGRIDVLISNAGLQHVSPVEEFPTEKFELLIRVMLVGPFLMAKHAFPIMKEQKYGRIINMASINGLVGFAGKAAYNSAKHGVIGLTKVLALEGALFNITANALCPGYVDTDLVRNQLTDLARTRGVALEKVLEEVIYPLVPQKRLLHVDEIAHYALFLASEKAGGVTGQAVVIDGGYTAQ